jgi:hypothetical protein
MNTSMEGNGSGKFSVHQQDMGGWVRVFTDSNIPVPSDLPVYLSQVLTTWFRQHPELRARTIVPVTRDGATVELHAWYEMSVFPEPTTRQDPQE